MHSFVRLGANRSDAQWHRADVQRRMADEGAMSCHGLVKHSTRARWAPLRLASWVSVTAITPSTAPR
jgi:hypothetical protein